MRWTEIIKELKRLDDLDSAIRIANPVPIVLSNEDTKRLTAIENRVWFFSNLLAATVRSAEMNHSFTGAEIKTNNLNDEETK